MKNKLNILWTTDNTDTVFGMLTIYVFNAVSNGWWDNVNVIIWGASARLVGDDGRVRAEIKAMLDEGVTVEACKDCADHYGVAELLEGMGVEVCYMGEKFTGYLKDGESVVTI